MPKIIHSLPLQYGHLCKADTWFCPFGVRIKEVWLYKAICFLGGHLSWPSSSKCCISPAILVRTLIKAKVMVFHNSDSWKWKLDIFPQIFPFTWFSKLFFTKHEMLTILSHLILYIPCPSYAILHSYFWTLFLIQGLKVTMKKHPSSYKLNEPLKSRNALVKSEATVLYDGSFFSYCCVLLLLFLNIYVILFLLSSRLYSWPLSFSSK